MLNPKVYCWPWMMPAPGLIAILTYLSPSIFVAMRCCGGAGVGVAKTVAVAGAGEEVPIGRADLLSLEGLVVLLDVLDVQPAVSTASITKATISPIIICVFVIVPSLQGFNVENIARLVINTWRNVRRGWEDSPR